MLEPFWQHWTDEELQTVEENWQWITFQLGAVKGRKLALVHSIQKAFCSCSCWTLSTSASALSLTASSWKHIHRQSSSTIWSSSSVQCCQNGSRSRSRLTAGSQGNTPIVCCTRYLIENSLNATGGFGAQSRTCPATLHPEPRHGLLAGHATSPHCACHETLSQIRASQQNVERCTCMCLPGP